MTWGNKTVLISALALINGDKSPRMVGQQAQFPCLLDKDVGLVNRRYMFMGVCTYVCVCGVR